MKITLHAVGTRMPGWVQEGCETYTRRMPPQLRVDIREVALAKRGRDDNPVVAMNRESEQLLAGVSDRDHVIPLEVGGSSWSTEQLADRLEKWQLTGGNVALLIGGPDGLAENCRERANQQWSLSSLTLPHPLVRVIVVEQLYRAWTITSHHPYHR